VPSNGHSYSDHSIGVEKQGLEIDTGIEVRFLGGITKMKIGIAEFKGASLREGHTEGAGSRAAVSSYLVQLSCTTHAVMGRAGR
jgi:hypothetical protein